MDLDLVGINEAARIVGHGVDWLRELDRRGTLKPATKLANGTRLYARADVERYAVEKQKRERKAVGR